MSNAILVSTLGDWAAAIAALPANGALPQRTVLVPSERHAHALRREIIRRGEARVLAGTLFASPAAAAAAVLERARIAFSPGENGLRSARVLALFRENLPLQHFDLELLRSTPGWDEAIAHAIGQLESAGLRVEDLPAADPLLADVALFWSRVNADAGSSWSSARVFAEAAALLAATPTKWPYRGTTVAFATGHETPAAARFLAAIPDVTLAFRELRPLRASDRDRLKRLYGAAAEVAFGASQAASPKTERDLLATYLFQPPEVVAAPERPRRSGPDGTFHLEEHAGVEAEVEAAAEWVARKVLEGVPLEEIAVLVAVQDPLAQLVTDRIERLEVGGRPVPAYVAGGLPAVSTAAGARALAAVRALAAHLSAETLAVVLPALRIDAEGRTHLSHGEAMEVAYSLGTVGGNAADPRGALAWSTRAAARVAELEAAVQWAHSDEDSSARELWRLKRTLANLVAIRPALDALVGIARAVVDDAPLAAVWEAFSGFLSKWLLAPGEGPAVVMRLSERLAPACLGALGKLLRGRDALAVFEEELLALRVPRRRFGEPAVYVGTVADAAGLEFSAVRVVGLCEGVLPSQPHDNPVLPERARQVLAAAVPGVILPTAEDRVSAQLHALFSAVRGAREEIVLSAPRVDANRTEREPSALFIEAAAAVGRPNAATGAASDRIPNSAALARDYFAPARAAAAAFRAERPVTESAWLARAAGPEPLQPPSWSNGAAVALGRVAELRKPTGALGAGDGVLGAGGPFPRVPGLEPERPISASALKDLLQCPRMFLMRRVLGWDDPASKPTLRELEAMSFGSLLHKVVEEFYDVHGADFVARKKTYGQWRKVALAIADRASDEFLQEYPLVGERIRAKERQRLHDTLAAFLEYDWAAGTSRRFVGVELGFGQEAPLAVAADGVTLHLQGYIDRVDVEGGVTVVRDLKSGKAHLRTGDEEGPTVLRDVQLGVYALVAKKLATEWGTPKKVVAAYAYASPRGDVQERSFRDDPVVLAEATNEWLATAAHLLHERAFASTPDPSDCEYCAFGKLCGTETPKRAADGMEGADGALARYRALKLGDDEEDDG